MGGDVLDNSWGTLKKGGYLVSIAQPPEEDKAKALGVNAEFCFVQPNAAQLGEIATLIDAGKIKVLIDSVYRLDEVAQAHQKSEAGHAQGKIVIQVAD
jgi:NADPH:quinone reductase-like Zn-dependent oxidoreductase